MFMPNVVTFFFHDTCLGKFALTHLVIPKPIYVLFLYFLLVYNLYDKFILISWQH